MFAFIFSNLVWGAFVYVWLKSITSDHVKMDSVHSVLCFIPVVNTIFFVSTTLLVLANQIGVLRKFFSNISKLRI